MLALFDEFSFLANGARRVMLKHVVDLCYCAFTPFSVFIDSKNFLQLLQQFVIYLATILDRCIIIYCI